MKRLLILLVLGVLTLPAKKAHADASPLEGLWLTQNERSVIEIIACEQGLCGYVHWIIDGGMMHDAKNPEDAKRGRPMCGLPILWGFEKESEMAWDDGYIYKADDGDIYDAEMELIEPDKLKVRGYLGFALFGKSQVWHRVQAKKFPRCKR